MNEVELVDLILARLGSAARHAQLTVGPGDDAAVVAWERDQELVVSTDVLLDGVHVPENCPGDLVGYRSVAISVSDIIAMGAVPRFLIVALTIEQADVDWITDFADGVRVGCETAQTTVVGGNVARGAKHVAITAMGSVPHGQSIRRNTAQPDDDIWITGILGASVLALQDIATWVPHALAKLKQLTSADVFARYLLPPIRTDFVSCLRNSANACTDISDGLALELEQLVLGSSYGYRIDTDEVPLWHDAELADVLSRDDNYELLFTAPKNKRDDVLHQACVTGTPISRIGCILGTSERVFAPSSDLVLSVSGYSHF